MGKKSKCRNEFRIGLPTLQELERELKNQFVALPAIEK
jgi:hypothetical protein